MTNVYVFRDDTSTPEGWTLLGAGYRERLIKGNGTPLETGGTNTHNHPGSVTSVSSVTYDGTKTNTGSEDNHIYQSGTSHNHNNTGSCSVGYTSNFPAYETLRVVYRSLTGWNFKLPAGSIVFREEVPAANWARTWTGKSSFILASVTAGSTGGNVHSHGVSGTTGSTSNPQSSSSTPSTSAAGNNHNHSYNTTISGSSPDYYYWGCGLIKSTAETNVPQDAYLLFSDTPPSSQWEVITAATNRYLRATSDYAVATGGSYEGYTHSHTGSGDSGASNNPMAVYIGIAGTTRFSNSHVHSLNISLQSTTSTPSYTRMVLARANRNLFVDNVAGPQLIGPLW